MSPQDGDMSPQDGDMSPQDARISQICVKYPDEHQMFLMTFISYRADYISGAERKVQTFITKIGTLFGYFTTMYQIL
jgi:hypothetical protein